MTGYCYYLEDGVEEGNLIEFNLAAHVHFLGAPPRDPSQWIADVEQASGLSGGLQGDRLRALATSRGAIVSFTQCARE